LEQIAQLLGPQWQLSFYRTAAGAEMDVIAERGNRKIGFEIKFSSAPKLTKGGWAAIADLNLSQTYVVAPVESAYPLANNVEVVPAAGLVKLLLAL
jgi:predicted AAA+ superfamily ATPase